MQPIKSCFMHHLYYCTTASLQIELVKLVESVKSVQPIKLFKQFRLSRLFELIELSELFKMSRYSNIEKQCSRTIYWNNILKSIDTIY